MDVTIRPMHRDEVGEVAIEMAAREGWNPGLHDAACFHAADPDGFLLAECDGQKAGCISAVSYGGRFGFIGLYIVAPAWRGRGVGRRLWDAGIARLSGQPIGLDGVPAQQGFYRRSGFALAWRNVRYAGVARPPGIAGGAAGIDGGTAASSGPGIAGGTAAGSAPGGTAAAPPGGGVAGRAVALAGVDFAELCADDRRTFPAARDAFLRCWTAMADATGLAWLRPDGSLAGWGLIRRCREGHKIGPLLADAPPVAAALYAALGGSVPAGDAVYLDVPMPNGDAVALAAAQGMRPVFETARMYAGAAPPCDFGRLYGITTFELG